MDVDVIGEASVVNLNSMGQVELRQSQAPRKIGQSFEAK